MAFIPIPPDDETERPDDQPENLLDSQDGGDEVSEKPVEDSPGRQPSETAAAAEPLDEPQDAPDPPSAPVVELPIGPDLAAAVAAERAANAPREVEPPPLPLNPFARGGFSGLPVEPQARLELPELATGPVDIDAPGTTLRSRSPQDDLSTGAPSGDRPLVSDLVGRRGDPVRIEVGPYDPAKDPDAGRVRLDRETFDPAGMHDRRASTTHLDARSRAMLSPTSDGGPPLARPIVIVRLPEDELRHVREEALLDTARRDAQTCEEIAQDKCDKLLYFLHTEERRLNPDLR